MRGRLGHVYWIGGGSGAGKSTTARHLASRFGLRAAGSSSYAAAPSGGSRSE